MALPESRPRKLRRGENNALRAETLATAWRVDVMAGNARYANYGQRDTINLRHFEENENKTTTEMRMI